MNVSVGESYISSYIKSACSTNTVDNQSGLSMYDSYCATAFPENVQITGGGTEIIQLSTDTSKLFTPSATGSTSTLLSSISSKTTENLTPNTDGNPTSTDGSGSQGQPQGFSESDKIAFGVGIGVGLPATIGTLVTCCYVMAGRR